MDEAGEVTFVPTLNAVINPLPEKPPTITRQVCASPSPCIFKPENTDAPVIAVNYTPHDVLEMVAISAIFGAGLALLLKYAFSKGEVNV